MLQGYTNTEYSNVFNFNATRVYNMSSIFTTITNHANKLPMEQPFNISCSERTGHLQHIKPTTNNDYVTKENTSYY